MNKLQIVIIIVLGVLFLRTFWLLARNSEAGRWRAFVLLSIVSSILVILFSNNVTIRSVGLFAGLLSGVCSEVALYREKKEVFLMTLFIALSLFAFGIGISLIL